MLLFLREQLFNYANHLDLERQSLHLAFK